MSRCLCRGATPQRRWHQFHCPRSASRVVPGRGHRFPAGIIPPVSPHHGWTDDESLGAGRRKALRTSHSHSPRDPLRGQGEGALRVATGPRAGEWSSPKSRAGVVQPAKLDRVFFLCPLLSSAAARDPLCRGVLDEVVLSQGCIWVLAARRGGLWRRLPDLAASCSLRKTDQNFLAGSRRAAAHASAAGLWFLCETTFAGAIARSSSVVRVSNSPAEFGHSPAGCLPPPSHNG